MLLLIPAALACDNSDARTGPDPTTLAIMETEPAPASALPSLDSGWEPVDIVAAPASAPEGSVEEDGLVAAGVEIPAPELAIPRSLGVQVRAGESLVLLADWADSSVEILAELNGLDVSEPLFPGQSLLLPSSDELSDLDLQARRDGFTRARLDRYLASRGGLVEVAEHRVRTGETAWGIARDQMGIPTWVLEAYNEQSELDRLSIGQVLQVPVLADTVAELEVIEPEEELEESAPEVEEEPLPPISETVILGDMEELRAIEESIDLEEPPLP